MIFVLCSKRGKICSNEGGEVGPEKVTFGSPHGLHLWNLAGDSHLPPPIIHHFTHFGNIFITWPSGGIRLGLDHSSHLQYKPGPSPHLQGLTSSRYLSHFTLLESNLKPGWDVTEKQSPVNIPVGTKSRYFSWNTLRCVPSLAGADGESRGLLVTGAGSKSFSQLTFSSEITPGPCNWAWWRPVLECTLAGCGRGGGWWLTVAVCVTRPGSRHGVSPPPGNRAGRGGGLYMDRSLLPATVCTR